MTVQRTLRWLVAASLLSGVAWLGNPSASVAAGGQCAQTASSSTPAAPVPGQPCWVDVNPYPFGADGNPVDPSSAFCTGNLTGIGPNANGPGWSGDFASGFGIPGNPPCYEQVTSMAFRAWNRGLAATELLGSQTNAYGVWLYNGSEWFPDPTFPGSNVCPGNTVLWAGKLDYWLIGSATSPATKLCRFDGVNLVWESLTLPAATIAHEALENGSPSGGITSGTCFAWNNCWFFGEDGIEVHWDGQQLGDASSALGNSPWLQGNFTSATSVSTTSGSQIGLAVNDGQTFDPNSTPVDPPTPAAPDGSAAPVALASAGGPWSPLSIPLPADPNGTALLAADTNASGDTWIAAQGAQVSPGVSGPTELIALNPDGTEQSCPAFGPNAFTPTGAGAPQYRWGAVGAAPDGSVVAVGWSAQAAPQYESHDGSAVSLEPVLVQGSCATPPTVTEFRRPDPFETDAATASMVPMNEEAGGTTPVAVSASAPNDLWAATGTGVWQYIVEGAPVGGPERPHLYQYTDGGPPDAPAGDDNETRPSLFTVGPPQYSFYSPTVVVTPTQTTTMTRRVKLKRVKLPPAIYGLRTVLKRGARGTYILSLIFRVRRPVTIGLEALHGKRVVARTPMRRFTGHRGELSIAVTRQAWPTGLKLISPHVHNRAKG